MKKIINKLKSKIGFTLTELLATTIIMMLATGLITSTLNTGINLFNKGTAQADAQLLCSVLTNYAQSELVYATYYIGSDTFDSNIHNMGEGAKFLVKDGRMVETSPAYKSAYKSDHPSIDDVVYDIAGKDAYDIDGPGRLYARFEILPDPDILPSSVVVHIWIDDSENTNPGDPHLAEQSIRVVPMEMVN